MKKRVLASVLAGLCALALLTGCGGDTGTTAEDTGSETGGETRDDLVIALATEPTQLDPHYLGDTNSSLIVLNTHDPLFRRMPSGEIVPALAEDYEMS